MAAPLLIEGRRHAPQKLGRVLVLGLGKSGRAAVSYLAPLIGFRVSELVVAAGKRTDAAAGFAECAVGLGARVLFDHERIEDSYDLCIASPGISQFSAFYKSAAAASAEIVSEVEFAWRESACGSRWVAVTGTNGKTTTTALAAHLLRGAGMRAAAVGNIGDTCLDAVAAGAADVYVAEVSSYQLASTTRFAPNVAVLLNITPDHLAWHGSLEEYRAAKLKVLANLSDVPGAVAVLDATDDAVRAEVRRLRQLSDAERGFSYIPLGTVAGLAESMRERCGADNAAYVADGTLRVELAGRVHDLGRASDLQIKGSHNVANALAAASAALALGADDAAVARGLASFAPLEHRIEPCGSVAGVACYNDSKATNVDATLKALSAFAPGTAVVLLGGHDKGTDLAPLVEEAVRCAKAVVCFGAAGQRFFEAFCQTPRKLDAAEGCSTSSCGSGPSSRAEARFLGPLPQSDALQPSSLTDMDQRGSQGGIPVLRAGNLEDALDTALSVAQPGDTVLLSPACASFDEFSCFEERGRAFKALVDVRAAAQGR